MRIRKTDGSSKLALLVAVLVFIVAFMCASHSRPIRKLLNVRVVEIPLNSDIEIRPVMVSGESFSKVVDRLHPYAAINGTYYDENMRPLGDLVVGGRVVNRGCYRNALAVRRDGTVEFLHRRRGRLRWRGYEAGLAAGPRLVHSGMIVCDPVSDGFSRKSITKKAWRSGVGVTKSGKLLLVTAKEDITLSEFAHIMLDLGAVEAMNLDGGGACGLYHNGRYLADPPLPMANILAVFKKSH